MKIIRNLLAVLFLLFAIPVWAVTYKVSNTDGTADYSLLADVDTAIYGGTVNCGDSIVFNNCDTFTDGVPAAYNLGVMRFGPGQNCSATNPITITSYGACSPRKPTFNSLNALSSAIWTAGTGDASIFYATIAGNFPGNYQNPTILVEDDTRMIDLPSMNTWTTSTAYSVDAYAFNPGTSLPYKCLIAHTSGTFATDLSAGRWEAYPEDDTTFYGTYMTPGSFVTPNHNDWTADRKVYVKTSDGLSPATHIMKAPKVNKWFSANIEKTDNVGGIIIDGLKFEWANYEALSFGTNPSGSVFYSARDVTLTNNEVYNSGVTGIRNTGINAIITDNYIYDSGGSDGFAGDTPAIVCYNCIDGEVSGNHSKITRRGTDIEIGFTSKRTKIFNNLFEDGSRHCVENWVGNTDNEFYNNICDKRGAPFAETGSYLFAIAPSSTGDMFYNNLLISGDIMSGAIRLKGGNQNRVFNNTFIAPGSAGYSWGAVFSYENGTGNEVENNIFITNDSGDEVYYRHENGTNTYNNNVYYNPNNSNFKAMYSYGGSLENFATWQARGYDALSVIGNPNVDATYKPTSSSNLLIDVGLTIDGASTLDGWATDLAGNPRIINLLDIGAYEYQGAEPEPTPGGNGKVQLRGFRGRIRIH